MIGCRNDHQPKFIKLQVLDSRLVQVAKDKVWVGSGVGAPVLDMSETVPPGTRIARVLAGKLVSPTIHNIRGVSGPSLTLGSLRIYLIFCPFWMLFTQIPNILGLD